MAVLTDSSRAFVSSDFARLEVLPKAIFNRFEAEREFYEAFFEGTASFVPFDAVNLHDAFDEACRSGLSAIDAIHIAAAAQSGCDELVTTERPQSPMHRTGLIKTVSIDAE